MTTIPISDVVPLAQWIQAYHTFRARLDLTLYTSGLGLLALHQDRFGPPAQPGVWETCDWRAIIKGRTLTFEVPEKSSADSAIMAFNQYQKRLFEVSPMTQSTKNPDN